MSHGAERGAWLAAGFTIAGPPVPTLVEACPLTPRTRAHDVLQWRQLEGAST